MNKTNYNIYKFIQILHNNKITTQSDSTKSDPTQSDSTKSEPTQYDPTQSNIIIPSILSYEEIKTFFKEVYCPLNGINYNKYNSFIKSNNIDENEINNILNNIGIIKPIDPNIINLIINTSNDFDNKTYDFNQFNYLYLDIKNKFPNYPIDRKVIKEYLDLYGNNFNPTNKLESNNKYTIDDLFIDYYQEELIKNLLTKYNFINSEFLFIDNLSDLINEFYQINYEKINQTNTYPLELLLNNINSFFNIDIFSFKNDFIELEPHTELNYDNFYTLLTFNKEKIPNLSNNMPTNYVELIKYFKHNLSDKNFIVPSKKIFKFGVKIFLSKYLVKNNLSIKDDTYYKIIVKQLRYYGLFINLEPYKISINKDKLDMAYLVRSDFLNEKKIKEEKYQQSLLVKSHNAKIKEIEDKLNIYNNYQTKIKELPITINDLKQNLLKVQTNYNKSNNIIKSLITSIKKMEDPYIDVINKLKEVLKSESNNDSNYSNDLNDLYNKYKSQYKILILANDKINLIKKEISIAEKNLLTYTQIDKDNIQNLIKSLKNEYDTICLELDKMGIKYKNISFDLDTLNIKSNQSNISNISNISNKLNMSKFSFLNQILKSK